MFKFHTLFSLDKTFFRTISVFLIVDIPPRVDAHLLPQMKPGICGVLKGSSFQPFGALLSKNFKPKMHYCRYSFKIRSSKTSFCVQTIYHNHHLCSYAIISCDFLNRGIHSCTIFINANL